MIYDAAIVGTGPAGVSAALNLKLHEKNFIWIGSSNLSDKISKAELVQNYPGFPAIDGMSLNKAFKGHIDTMGIEITDQMVNSIISMGKYYAVMAGSDYYEAKTIILACGVAQSITLPGEDEFLGKGVSYCATCDGNLYRGKTIAIICNNKRFEHEVKYLANLAKEVYYIPQYPEVGIEAENIQIVNANPVSINGKMRTESITLSDGQDLMVDGIFCLRDSVAFSTLLPKLETENGHITVDRRMATNLPGIFAAGDCTGRPYQYTKAVGEGNIAAHSVIEYLI